MESQEVRGAGLVIVGTEDKVVGWGIARACKVGICFKFFRSFLLHFFCGISDNEYQEGLGSRIATSDMDNRYGDQAQRGHYPEDRYQVDDMRGRGSARGQNLVYLFHVWIFHILQYYLVTYIILIHFLK